MFIIQARTERNSLSVATNRASDALEKLREFLAEGLQATVVDVRGYAFPEEELQAMMREEANAAA